MKLPPRKNIPFWVAVSLTALGWLIYAYHLLAQFVIHVNILHLQMIPFVLVSVAFVLLFLELTIPGWYKPGQAGPQKGPDQSPAVETEKQTVVPSNAANDQAPSPALAPEEQTVSPLIEANDQAPAPAAGRRKPFQNYFSGRTRYYLVVAILCVVSIAIGYTPWADYQLAFLLFVGLPAGFWIIYKLSPEEKPGK